MAAPLTDLTKGKSSSVAIRWNPKAEAAFQSLKEARCKKLLLAAPDFGKEFVVQTDASSMGIVTGGRRRGTPGGLFESEAEPSRGKL